MNARNRRRKRSRSANPARRRADDQQHDADGRRAADAAIRRITLVRPAARTSSTGSVAGDADDQRAAAYGSTVREARHLGRHERLLVGARHGVGRIADDADSGAACAGQHRRGWPRIGGDGHGCRAPTAIGDERVGDDRRRAADDGNGISATAGARRCRNSRSPRSMGKLSVAIGLVDLLRQRLHRPPARARTAGPSSRRRAAVVPRTTAARTGPARRRRRSCSHPADHAQRRARCG